MAHAPESGESPVKNIDPRTLPTHPEVARRKKALTRGRDGRWTDAFVAHGKHGTESRKLQPKPPA